jgi:hypothetical protein
VRELARGFDARGLRTAKRLVLHRRAQDAIDP